MHVQGGFQASSSCAMGICTSRLISRHRHCRRRSGFCATGPAQADVCWAASARLYFRGNSASGAQVRARNGMRALLVHGRRELQLQPCDGTGHGGAGLASRPQPEGPLSNTRAGLAGAVRCRLVLGLGRNPTAIKGRGCPVVDPHISIQGSMEFNARGREATRQNDYLPALMAAAHPAPQSHSRVI